MTAKLTDAQREVALLAAERSIVECDSAWPSAAFVEYFAARFLAALPKPEVVAWYDEYSGAKMISFDPRSGGIPLYAEAPIQSAQGWHPIETAPKDGTAFDVWVKSTKNPDYGVRMTGVYYCEGVICGSRVPRADWYEYATHWMPLPAAPGANPTPQAAVSLLDIHDQLWGKKPDAPDDVRQRDELLAALEAMIKSDWNESFRNREYDSDDPEENALRDLVLSAIAAAKGEK